MWLLLYNVGLLLASPLILLVLASKARCRRGLPQRLGLRLPASPQKPVQTDRPDAPDARDATDAPAIWCHAVSLGEVTAIVPLLRELRARHPEYRMVVSTVTETGREAVEQRLAGIAEHLYAPLDFPWVVSRVIAALRPRLFLFVETELWPNLLTTLARQRVPAVLVNGRLSTKSFRGYGIVRSLWRRVLPGVSWFLMQSDRDAERILALGAPADRVRRTGNVKFDQPPPDTGSSQGLTREGLDLRGQEELIVAGSTHPGEEEQLLECYRQLHREFPNLVLMLAPRHIERAGDLLAAARARGFVAQRRSESGGSSDRSIESGRPRVIILDTRGELAYVYRHAVLAYVGGTLVPVGGHNLLEPAQWGKPVFYGLHTDHCAEVAALLVRAGGGVQAHDGGELLRRMGETLRDRPRLREMGERAQGVVRDNRGALDRNLAVIDGVLEEQGRRSPVPEPPARDLLATLQENGAVSPLLRALSILYGIPVGLRNRLYDDGWLRRTRLPRPVLSVGNLTVGGTGKTPFVIYLANRLSSHGARVAVLSRGYGRAAAGEPVLVSDGCAVLAGPAEAGDEPHLIAQRCPGVVVAVGSDRSRVGRWVLERFPIDCVVLDDGFQHRALEREVDLVLLDASDTTGLRGLLPAGRLREPLSNAARASALVVTRADSLPNWRVDLAPVLRGLGPGRPVVQARFVAEAVVELATGAARSPDVLNGRTAIAFSGVANPGSFRLLLARCGVTVVGERVFPDHHAYVLSDLEAIGRLAEERQAEMIVTTEKDAAKVARLAGEGCSIVALRLGTEIVEGGEALDDLVLGLINRRPAVVCA